MIPSPAVPVQTDKTDLHDVINYVNLRFTEVNRMFTELDFEVEDGSITTAKLADDAVTTVKIADDAVTSAKIADDSITNAHMGNDAINTAEIVDKAVTAAKLDISKLSDISAALGTITSGSLDSVTITKGDFTGKAVITTTGSEVGPYDVTSSHLFGTAMSLEDSTIYVGSPNTAGLNNDIVILDGSNSTWRLGVGNTAIASAPFRVTKTGDMTAPHVAGTVGGFTVSSTKITSASGGPMVINSNGHIDSGIFDSCSLHKCSFDTGEVSTSDIITVNKFEMNSGKVAKFDSAGITIGGLSMVENSSEIVVAGTFNAGTIKTSTLSLGSKVNFNLSSGNLYLDGGLGAGNAVSFKYGVTSGGAIVGTSIQAGSVAWVLNDVSGGSVTLDTSSYVDVTINGNSVKLAVVT